MQKKNKKIFDRHLFNKYDGPAKDKATEIFKTLGWGVKKNPDRYGVDLIAFKPKQEIFVETEVKLVWGDEKFPYPDLNLPYRKEKFLNKECPTLFIVFNKNMKKYMCIWGNDLRICPIVVLSNRFCSHEEFFKIDLPLVFESIKDALKYMPQSDFVGVKNNGKKNKRFNNPKI